MLYLEDFLEVVENVPTEVSEKTSEISEMDLRIQTTSELLDDQMKLFFSNAKKMKSGERAMAFEKIRRQYYKLLEDADEKFNVATNLYDSLERYIRRIDLEIEKFKFELEADSPGITELLEQRSLELDEPSKESQKENRSYYSRGISNYLGTNDWRHTPHIKKEDPDPNFSSNLSLSPPTSSSSLSYSLGHISTGGGNAIAVAASQAIAATQQMRPGRRTASLTASFDAVSQGVVSSDLSIGTELAHAAKAAIAASSLTTTESSSEFVSDGLSNISLPITRVNNGTPSIIQSSITGTSSGTATSTGSNKRQKKVQIRTVKEESPAPSEDLTEPILDSLSENSDWTFDPNEPRYCVCNQVSYGNMVACDNKKCPLEWFHYACVGITAPPKGKWFCPQCFTSLNRRQRK